MVVSALIFVLGFDLVKEALWDTRHRVSRPEYVTIASIMVAMTVWDFVVGVLFGIVISCKQLHGSFLRIMLTAASSSTGLFFVVQNSQRRSIRVMHTGEKTLSTVRRPSAHRAYLREVSQQTTVLHLQGFLFFGTITRVEETIRSFVTESAWVRAPIRFLLLDFALVLGVDLSAAEAFVRMQRLLSGKNVVLVMGRYSGRWTALVYSTCRTWNSLWHLTMRWNVSLPVCLSARNTNVSRRDGKRVSPCLV